MGTEASIPSHCSCTQQHGTPARDVLEIPQLLCFVPAAADSASLAAVPELGAVTQRCQPRTRHRPSAAVIHHASPQPLQHGACCCCQGQACPCGRAAQRARTPAAAAAAASAAKALASSVYGLLSTADYE